MPPIYLYLLLNPWMGKREMTVSTTVFHCSRSIDEVMKGYHFIWIGGPSFDHNTYENENWHHFTKLAVSRLIMVRFEKFKIWLAQDYDAHLPDVTVTSRATRHARWRHARAWCHWPRYWVTDSLWWRCPFTRRYPFCISWLQLPANVMACHLMAMESLILAESNFL